MKQVFVIAFSVLICSKAFSQQGLIPKQYKPIKETSGDLNKDGINEKVVVYNMAEEKEQEGDTGVAREVIIYKKEKNNWIIWHRSKDAVGGSKDGGMMGDPFENIEIKNGVLIITQSGGSSWKWRNIDKYRFQNNNFELIGNKSFFGKPCEYFVDFDYNIVTGRFTFKKEYENCENENEIIYKKENETFNYKLKQKIIFSNRKGTEVKVITPKYKYELYL